MPRRQLLATLLATMLLASGLAGATDPPTTENVAAPFSVLANSSITCSTAWPSSVTGCWWERPVLVLGAFEVAVGIDAQAALTGTLDDAHLAPYLIAAWYGEQASAWAELRLPELSGVPVLGSPDWLRVGFTLRFQ